MNSSNHGGYREGAGRPSIGTTRKLSLTLPDEIWEAIEEEKGKLTMAAYIRNLLLCSLKEKDL